MPQGGHLDTRVEGKACGMEQEVKVGTLLW